MGRDTVPVGADALAGFVERVLAAVGTRPDDAASVARVLVDADLRGIESHGVARLSAYVRLVDLGFVDLAAEPQVASRSGATAVVDAANGFGQPAAELAVDVACELAAEHGVGWVVVRHSNHFGVVGYYTRRAAARGLVAFGGTNSAAVVVPTRGAHRYLGTNPLAFAAPGATGPGISLDMSTSAVAGGKLEVASREGRSIPDGWVLTPDGEPTTDPAQGIAAGGGLLPLGGTEEHGSHKGYGLGLMVEVLSSGLVGGPFGPGVGPLTSSTPTGPADVSHFVMALDPERFSVPGGLGAHVDRLGGELRALPPVDADRPVLVPGDPEEATRQERRAWGIPIPGPVLAALDDVADRVGVPTVTAPVTRTRQAGAGTRG